MINKVAIVTGANRGIGFEIVRQLANLGVTVVLAARSEDLGGAAADKLRQEGLDVLYHQLDVTDEISIRQLAENMKARFGVVHILINNAGIFIDQDENGILEMDVDTLRATMETNVYGPMRLTQVLAPLLTKSGDGRVVNVSSGLGALNGMGGGYSAYGISKTALNALTIKLASKLRSGGVEVNAMCPGWVRTDMGGTSAPRSVEQGADTAVWLATSKIGVTGKFFRDRVIIDW